MIPGTRSSSVRVPSGSAPRRFPRSGLTLLLLGLLPACSDGGSGPPDPVTAEVGVVVGSTDRSLTIFEVDDPARSRTVGLGPDGSPVGLDVRGNLAAVPLGVVPAVAIIDLSSATLLRTVALPAGSGATGVAFVNDSIAVVANPSLNSVSPVNVLRGTVAPQIPVGRYPQEVLVHAGRIYVINAELVDFAPAGPGTVTVLDAASLVPVGTVTLSGLNPGSAAVTPDGWVHVLNSGRWGQNEGSLSTIDPGTLTEAAHTTGFGDFPGSVASGPDGVLRISSFSFGLALWSPGGSWVRAPGDATLPDALTSVSGMAFDSSGRLYALRPDCQNPSVAMRLGAALEVETEIPVGICPLSISFAEVEAG